MRNLRIIFRPPNIVLEHADPPFTPICNEELPVSPALRSRLEELSLLHATALACESVPNEVERANFEKLYRTVMPALEEELRPYGQIVDEVFPGVFERQVGTEQEQTSSNP